MTARSAWKKASPKAREALSGAWGSGVPPEATALYARWWQLETWLRQLVYLEQSAYLGARWAEILPTTAEKRDSQDQSQPYMVSPDAQGTLAYLDVTPLFNLLTEDWERYEHALIDQAAWVGRAVELKRIRHRIGHCRRPHGDDLSRLEQTLRDLDGGAFRTVASYNDKDLPDDTLDDPLVDAWVRRTHRGAGRLIAHAERQYEVALRLTFSRRPWAEPYEEGQPISGRPGYLWHVRFIMRGGRPVELRELWRDSYLSSARERLTFLTAIYPYDIEVSFPAIDAEDGLADAIEGLFDAILSNLGYRDPVPDPFDDVNSWALAHRDLDARVQLNSAWAIVDETTVPIRMFGA